MALLPLLVLLVFFLIMVSAARRAARRRAAYEEQLEREAAARGPARGGEDDDAYSPFGASPFGALFDTLMTGGGARSYTYDPVTGRWVDVSDERPDPPAEDVPDGRADGAQKPRQRRQKRRQAPQGGLGSLLGGGMMGGDGSGTFEVQSPGRADDVRGRRRDGRAEAGDPRHRRPRC